MELTQAALVPQVAPAWLTAEAATAGIAGGAVPTTMVTVLIATADAPVIGATTAGRLPATPFIGAKVATARMFAGVSPPKYASAGTRRCWVPRPQGVAVMQSSPAAELSMMLCS